MQTTGPKILKTTKHSAALIKTKAHNTRSLSLRTEPKPKPAIDKLKILQISIQPRGTIQNRKSTENKR